MKSFLLLATFLIGTLVNAQCSTTAFNFGNNVVSGYGISGAVDVVLNTNNSVTVNLGTNFRTAFGPDVRIYLVDRGTLTDNQLKMTNNFLSRPRLEIGLVTRFSGASTYTAAIPSGVNVSNYQTVYFFCLQFNQFWDYGTITPFTTSNCAVLSTDSVVAPSTVKIYPNPVSDILFIENDLNTPIKSIAIYNIQGSKMLEQDVSVLNEINLNLLANGLYLIQATDSNNIVSTTKFLKSSD